MHDIVHKKRRKSVAYAKTEGQELHIKRGRDNEYFKPRIYVSGFNHRKRH